MNNLNHSLTYKNYKKKLEKSKQLYSFGCPNTEKSVQSHCREAEISKNNNRPGGAISRRGYRAANTTPLK